MPFLVEMLQASSIETEYNPLEEALTFKIHYSITKGMLFERMIYAQFVSFIIYHGNL